MTKQIALPATVLAAALTFSACSAPTEKPAAETKSAATAAPTPNADKPESTRLLKIVRHSPAFDKLLTTKDEFPGDGTVVRLSLGHKWTEGPVWNRKENYLLFSDIPNNAIYKWQEGKGAGIFLQPAGYNGKEPFTGKEPGTNGLTYDAEGRLVMCQHGDRRVARLEADGKTVKTLADKFEGKRLNSPNDLVYHSNGDLYFTDPIYGLPKGADDPGRELDFCGVYRLGKNGKLTLLTKEITRPNGIAFSPDEKKLYVASSDPDKAIWMVYDVTADGTLANGKVFFDATAWAKEKRPGLPDGMKVDKDGNVFATGPGGVHVFAPDGTHLGTFETGVPTANVAFGDDGSTLYITANTAVIRIKLNTKGKGF
ncbi:MAG TPA: SMP-30/gluconolactonase/LRE family protein [Blastocatellia bacterium]|nr:SMP-30/gluconolactonase/LRE family protein [Blastocatellia bacterium]HMV83050.1 SMP-30/gluconolactonase/LRE family protein [Blastocatellia bacterium]HMX28505.1 SMP-30/gluconolactonase/LRE family protein [Blastocatellia bacterium]HMZ17761.1 SMP-30/gluconolactonase/LRE family protein [Blastocatellia bacterium]HNG32578.1 SMP-30/gluconolactonase/LRE family protein [Blastocatellia bacterium]